MAGPKPSSASPPGRTRPPVVAGLFYPAHAQACRSLAQSFVRDADLSAAPQGGHLVGGIVPHAGWICSGAIAGQTIAALAQQGPVDVVVVFGAIHTPLATEIAALDSHTVWELPGMQAQVPEELQAKLAEPSSDLFVVDERFHVREHAVEVEVPLIEQAWPGAAVLPIEVPVRQNAEEIGIRTVRMTEKLGLNAVYLASSDLTHYGPAYDFAPAGVGMPGLAWAKQNDRRLLDLVTEMRIDAIVPDVRENASACGGGAIVAMLAACREHGATHGTVLRHASSFETLAKVQPQPPDNAVGYAAVVVG